MQGHCYGDSCSSIAIPTSNGVLQLPREAYFDSLTGFSFNERWTTLGWLALISGIYVLVALFAARNITHLRK